MQMICEWRTSRALICIDLHFFAVAVQLYTQEFYETVVKAKLAPGGIFVTQSGPAGVLSATQATFPKEN